jgi:hypothetical protein
MMQDQWQECKKNLDVLLEKKSFDHCDTIIFGSNEPAEHMAAYLQKEKITVTAFVDNNQKQWGRKLLDIPIDSPEHILGVYKENTVILIASQYYNEMCEQLEGMGYFPKKNIFRTVDFNPSCEYAVTEEVFHEKVERVRRGAIHLADIKQSYDGNIPLFLCPYKGLGDVYLASAFLQTYLRKEQIKKSILVVIGNACGEVASLFDLSYIRIVTRIEAEEMMQAIIFIGKENCNSTILHHALPYTNQLKRLGNYRGLNFYEAYRKNLFSFSKDEKIALPKNTEDFTEDFFINHKLQKGKTVVMSPYANTSSKIPEKVWDLLIQQYIGEGYSVCTNCSGEEKPLNHTIEIRLPIRQMIPFCEKAGVFIGLRSGLCEVISSANCTKIIYYPDRIYYHGKMIDFFSLKKMGLCKDIEEIEYKGGNL